MKLYLIPLPLHSQQPEPYFSLYLDEIGHLRHFFVENERTARRFLSAIKFPHPIRELNLYVLDKKTKQPQLEHYWQQLKQQPVGVLSEAGCPGVADPGQLAVQHAHRKGWEVVPLVGPSSILLGLMSSGLQGQRFTFHGYLPVKPAERTAAILKLEQQSVQQRASQLFIETPYRNKAMVQALLNTCKGNTQLYIGAGLTAEHSFSHTKTIEQWRQKAPDLGKTPATFILQGE